MRLKPALIVLALLGATAPAHAVDKASRLAARDLGQEGVQAYQAGDYAAALDRLERAYATLKVPSLALWSARALEKNGQLIEASERYLEATRLTPEADWAQDVQKQAQAQAAEEREALLPRIPRLTIVVRGADPAEVEVTLRGAVVGRALYEVGHPTNPGTAEVVAVHGARRVSTSVTINEGAKQSVTLDFSGAAPSAQVGAAPLPPERANDHSPDGDPPKWQRTTGWIGIGVGASGLLLGTVTGIIAIGQNGELSTACPNGRCEDDQADALSEYRTMRTLSSVGLIAGGVLAAAGVTLLLTAPKRENTAYVSPYVGLTSVGLRGKF